MQKKKQKTPKPAATAPSRTGTSAHGWPLDKCASLREIPGEQVCGQAVPCTSVVLTSFRCRLPPPLWSDDAWSAKAAKRRSRMPVVEALYEPHMPRMGVLSHTWFARLRRPQGAGTAATELGDFVNEDTGQVIPADEMMPRLFAIRKSQKKSLLLTQSLAPAKEAGQQDAYTLTVTLRCAVTPWYPNVGHDLHMSGKLQNDHLDLWLRSRIGAAQKEWPEEKMFDAGTLYKAAEDGQAADCKMVDQVRSRCRLTRWPGWIAALPRGGDHRTFFPAYGRGVLSPSPPCLPSPPPPLPSLPPFPSPSPPSPKAHKRGTVHNSHALHNSHA